MATSHRALDADLFSVDPTACFRAARILENYERPREQQAWSSLPQAQQLTFKLAFIAICHSFNWDFLQHRLAEVLLTDPDQIARRLAQTTARDVKQWLADYSRQERVRAAERSKLLRDVGCVLNDEWQGDAANIIAQIDKRLSGDNGFFNVLDGFAAYRADPLRKKSQVLVHDLVRESILEFVDQREIAPAVDYHLMRIYIRSGRVRPQRHSLVPLLMGKQRPRARLVRLWREAVIEAARITAFYAHISVADLNYIEWQLGRTICLADAPQCKSAPRADLPHDVARLVGANCPYIEFCAAFNDPDYHFYREPQFKTTYY